MKEDRILRIYTDGGCAGNQSDENLGGWGAILEFGQAVKELYGSEKNTTNNRMEMTALLEALRAVKKENQEIHVFSDSSYLMDCFRKKWYVSWQKNGWKTAGKKPVENQDLWKALLPYIEIHRMTFYRVKGHVNLEMCIRDSCVGVVVNLWYGWHVWDYSREPGNLLGQICPLFSFIWFLPVSYTHLVITATIGGTTESSVAYRTLA